jgi:hypothetical protein
MIWCRNNGVTECEISTFLNNNLVRKRKKPSHEAILALKPFLSETYYLREKEPRGKWNRLKLRERL